MAETKRRRVEPEPNIENLGGAEIHKFGILRYVALVRPSEYAPQTDERVELPFDIPLSAILKKCFEILAHYGIECPDPKVVSQMMRRKGLEPPSEDAPPEEFLRADAKTYITAMFKSWWLDGDRSNWAHPVSQVKLIMLRIGYVLRLCEKSLGPLMRRWLADLAAGIGVAFGRLEMALEHERDALRGKVLAKSAARGGAQRRRARLDGEKLTTERRIALWREALAPHLGPDGKPRRGAISRVAKELAALCGTSPGRERRFAYEHADAILRRG